MGAVDCHKLDLRGAIMPFSLLKISQAFKTAQPGEIIEILCNDPDTQADLLQILPSSEYELLDSAAVGGKAAYRVALKKKAGGPIG